MEIYNWNLGELATLPRMERQLKKRGVKSYDYFVASRFICVREATEGHRGILVKVLGRLPSKHVITISGQPFCKDDREDLIAGTRYYSYPFPDSKQIKEVLDILQSNPNLLQIFEEASMHINLQATFWVSDTSSHLLFLKKPQCYDFTSNSLCTASGSDAPYRISIAYFYKDSLSW